MAPKVKKNLKDTKSGNNASAAAHKRFGKNLIRHTPDNVGHFLWITRKDKCQKEKGLLALERIAKSRTKDNCEALAKMQNYISEESATIHLANDYLTGSCVDDKFLKHLHAEGADFLKAAEFLDKKHGGDKKKDDAAKHVQARADFLTKLPDEQLGNLKQLILDSARAYLLGTSILEQKALQDHPNLWHENIVLEHQKGDAGSFQKSGKSSKLLSWQEEVAKKNVKDHEPRNAKKIPTRSDDSDGEQSEDSEKEVSKKNKKSEDSGSSSSSASSSDDSKKKKKKKKGKSDSKKRNKDKKSKKKDKKGKKAKS